MGAGGGNMLLDAAQRDELLRHIDAYPADYDEVFDQVGDRLSQNGYATKCDIGALVLWKAMSPISFAKELNGKPDREVQKASREAFAQRPFDIEHDSERLDALALIPGMKHWRNWGALASTLLAAFGPVEFGVFDTNAHSALTHTRKLGICKDIRLPEYFGVLRELRDELRDVRPGVTARDVDKGLFQWGRQEAT